MDVIRPDRGAPVSVFDMDADLGRAADGNTGGAARRAAIVRTATVPAGTGVESWPAREGLGLLVAEGILLRHVRVGRARSVEFVGNGDVIQPWLVTGDEIASVPAESSWTVLTATTVGILDEAFVERLARVSPLTLCELFQRAVERSRWLMYFMAVHSLVHVQDRLVYALWRLADRWGCVRGDGTVICIPNLTHELLAELVGARRPSVTTAVSHLAQQGSLRRDPDGMWVLTGKPGAAGPRRGAREGGISFLTRPRRRHGRFPSLARG